MWVHFEYLFHHRFSQIIYTDNSYISIESVLICGEKENDLYQKPVISAYTSLAASMASPSACEE